MIDPFAHPLVGTVLDVKVPAGSVKWECIAWGDEGSRWLFDGSGLYYTNCHAMWRKVIGPQYRKLERESRHDP